MLHHTHLKSDQPVAEMGCGDSSDYLVVRRSIAFLTEH